MGCDSTLHYPSTAEAVHGAAEAPPTRREGGGDDVGRGGHRRRGAVAEAAQASSVEAPPVAAGSLATGRGRGGFDNPTQDIPR
jgi:hypothetical protein